MTSNIYPPSTSQGKTLYNKSVMFMFSMSMPTRMMGFDRERKEYQCGCYSESFYHDSFNDTDSRGCYYNVCGQHADENDARDDRKKSKIKRALEKAEYVLMTEMDPVPIIPYLRGEKIISEEDEERLSRYKSKARLAKDLFKVLFESKRLSLHGFRMALIKTGQSKLLKYLTESNENDDDADIMKSFEGRCMLHLDGDCYVVANDFKDNVLIHIRNYFTTGSKKYPTKQGVCLTLSRWLVLTTKKDHINDIFQKGLAGDLKREELIHLGGGVYVTLNPKYPTVDIRHFWKPENTNKPVATKRGVALNNVKWLRLCYAMDLMADFVPELNDGVICELTHNNEMGMLECKECTPFPDIHNSEDDDDTLPIHQNQEGDLEIANAMIYID